MVVFFTHEQGFTPVDDLYIYINLNTTPIGFIMYFPFQRKVVSYGYE